MHRRLVRGADHRLGLDDPAGHVVLSARAEEAVDRHPRDDGAIRTTVRPGVMSALITLLGAPVRGFAGGPAYVVTLTGRGPLGSGPSASVVSRGVPAVAGGSLAATSGATRTFPVRVSVNGITVTLTARDDRLMNQPFTRSEVTSNDAGNGSVTSPLSVDSVGGPLG